MLLYLANERLKPAPLKTKRGRHNVSWLPGENAINCESLTDLSDRGYGIPENIRQRVRQPAEVVQRRFRATRFLLCLFAGWGAPTELARDSCWNLKLDPSR